MRASSEPAQPAPPAFVSLRVRFGLLLGDASGCAPVERAGAFGCDCTACARWHNFVAGRLPDAGEGGSHPRYELYTEEHVHALAAYLLERRAAYGISDRAMRVLEVGAGDGRLAHYLGLALLKLGGTGAVELTATDSDARGLRAASPVAALVRVAPCDAELLRAEQPDVVVACWMPFGVDWTATFRSCASVREYVLIGEANGICGRPWETWGCRGRGGGGSDDDGDDDDDDGDKSRAAPRRTASPHEADGFVRVDLPELSRWQLCRTDERWRSRGASRTVAFRRASV